MNLIDALNTIMQTLNGILKPLLKVGVVVFVLASLYKLHVRKEKINES